MSLVITIDGVDRTSIIDTRSLQIKDKLNNRTNECTFAIKKYGSEGIKPSLDDEVIVTLNGTVIFGGVIVSYDESVEGKNVLNYDITCKDYSQYLNRRLVTERYEDMTINDIIADLLDVYAEDFTNNNVIAPVTIDSISFNRITVSQCLDKLAKLVSYSWYIDNEKDIHFFSKNTEVSPFNITDTSNNYIYESLNINKDLSQIRNKIIVQGGEEVGVERSQSFDGDGTNNIFTLAYKYSSLPTVTVDSVAQNVGIENLQNEASYNVMWDFNQKTLRFTTGNEPASGTNNIVVTGTPLYPILVQVPSPVSIGEYGVYEYAITDRTIKSRDEAIDRAIAELTAYGESISEGSFKTYRSGLRAGQTITVNSALRGINEGFLIQDVTFKVVTTKSEAKINYIYDVNLATLKTIGIIEVLQRLLLDEELSEGEQEVLLTYLQFSDSFSLADVLGEIETTSPPYVYSNDEGTTPNKGRYSLATYS